MVWNCKGCKRQFSAKIGTIFEESPLPFSKWLPAMWLIANAKNGISSCEVARALGVTQKTAWFMLHRIRLAFESGSIEKLSGHVRALSQVVGKRVTYRELTGKELVLA
jgi:transposase-like protein